MALSMGFPKLYTCWGLSLRAEAIPADFRCWLGDSSVLCFWSLGSGSLDVGCHASGLDGQRTVSLDSEGPGATIGITTDHVLVGVVLMHIRSGLFNFQKYATLQPALVEGRSRSRPKAESKLRRLGAMSTSCDWWDVVKILSADTGPGKGTNEVYTRFFG